MSSRHSSPRGRGAGLWLSAVLCVSAASGPAADPVSLDPLLESVRATKPVPALAAAVVRRGETVALGAVGFRKDGSTERVTRNDRWHIGSCTKSMTAVLAAMLVEEDRMRWDTTLPEIFPALASEMNAEWRGVTLEQLLAHRGGVFGAGEDETELNRRLYQCASQPPIEQRAYLAREVLTRHKPVAPPGTRYLYSNAGYVLAGHAIELKLGRPWEDLLRERLGKPLGLDSLGFGAPATVGQIDQPWGHEAGAEGKWKPIPPGLQADNPAGIGPAGTVHCSVGDLAKYAAWQVRGARGDGNLLKAETFKKLHTPISAGEYALGWVVVNRPWGGGEVLTHAGSNTLFYAVIWLAPKKDFAVVVCTNLGGDAAFQAVDLAAARLIQEFLTGPERDG